MNGLILNSTVFFLFTLSAILQVESAVHYRHMNEHFVSSGLSLNVSFTTVLNHIVAQKSSWRKFKTDGKLFNERSSETDQFSQSVQIRTLEKPLVFTENKGQVNDTEGKSREDILYTAYSSHADFYFSRRGISYVFTNAGTIPSRVSEATLKSKRTSPDRYDVKNGGMQSKYRLDLEFIGSNERARILPAQSSGTYSNFYLPSPFKEITQVPEYSKLVYTDIYDGINLEIHAMDKGMRYDFLVSPGADPSDIRMKWMGAQNIARDMNGNLIITTEKGGLRSVHSGIEGNSSAWQLNDGVLTVSGSETDKKRPEVITLYLQWSTYYGGSYSDYARDVGIDRESNIYVAGYTTSKDFPVTTGAFQISSGGNLDAFIMKFGNDRNVQWATYFGGSGEEESPRLAIERTGNFVMLAGQTTSADLPVSPGAWQSKNNGKNDVFLLKLNSSGIREWATYIGGSYSDECAGVVVDSKNDIIVTGATYSTNFPVSKGAYQTSNSGDYDIFVVKFGAGGQRLWATYYGGWSMDYANAVTTDAQDNVIITGHTEGSNFPVSRDAMQSRYSSGMYDAFLVKFTGGGSRLWATYFGGNKEDAGRKVAADQQGNIILTGYSDSPNLPIFGESYQKQSAGMFDAFIAKYDSKGALIWSTLYGGGKQEQGTCMALDNAGNIYVAGYTESADFPVSSNPLQAFHAGAADVFILRFNNAGKREWATFFGGRDQDIPYGIAVDPSGNIVIAGTSASPDFPLMGTKSQEEKAGYTDIFITRIIFDMPIANAGRDTIVCIGTSVVIGKPAKGGKPPYKYSWSPSIGLDNVDTASPTARPSSTIRYYLTVTDSEGASSSDSIKIEVRGLPKPRAGSNVSICRGSSVTLGGEVTGGLSPYWYTWSPAKGLNATDIANPTASPDVTTTYTLTVRDMNNCYGRDSMTVTVLPSVKANAGPDQSVCAGSVATIGGLAAGGVSPYAYAWSPSNGLSTSDIATPAASPDTTTRYILTVTDAKGCMGFDTVLVRVLPRLLVDAGPDFTICKGESVKLGGQKPTGKEQIKYSWSPKEGLSSTVIPDPTAKPLTTTNYILSAVGGNGCVTIDTVTVIVNTGPKANAGPDVNMCEGTSTPIGEEATGGTPAYAYSWTPSVGLSATDVATPIASPTTSTTYIVTVTDANGCRSKDTINVFTYPIPRIKVDPDFSMCAGSKRKITVSAKGGKAPLRYEWSPKEGLSDWNIASPVASPEVSTTYTATVIDANGCRISDTIRITVRPCDKADAGKDVEICSGSIVALGGAIPDPANNPKYFWSPSKGLSATDVPRPEAAPSKTTDYFLKVVNMYGCEDYDTVSVTVRPGPTANAGPPVSICEGSSVRIGRTATGGIPPYSYSWSPQNGLSAPDDAQPLASPHQTTLYTLTVTDAQGCKDTQSVVVAVHPLPVANAGADVSICHGASVELGVEVKPEKGSVSYIWKPAIGMDKSAVARPKAKPDVTTTYILTATSATGCQNADTVTIRVNPLPRPIIKPGGSTTICDGEEAILDAGNGYESYRWSNGANTRTIRVNKTGAYSVAVVDEHGCGGTSPVVQVQVNPVPPARIIAKGPLSFCEGESVTLDAGSGFRWYEWSNGETTREIVVTKSGTYTVTVANASGCSAVSPPVEISVRPKPIADLTQRNDSLLVSPAARYQWFLDGKPIKDATNREYIAFQSGKYHAIVSNQHGCNAVSKKVNIEFIAMTVSLGKAECPPGEAVRIPLFIADEKKKKAISTQAFIATIRFKKKTLSCLSPTVRYEEEGSDAIVTIQGKRSAESDTLVYIEFKADGNFKGKIPLRLEDFRWLEGLVKVATKDGEIRMKKPRR